MERVEARGFFGAVGPEDQIQKCGFFFGELPLLFGFAEVWIDADVVLPFVFAEIEDFERGSFSLRP